MTNFDYWLVSKERIKKNGDVLTIPLALVRCGEFTANAVAGDKTLARDYEKHNDGVFTDGKPDPQNNSSYIFTFMGRYEAWHPLIGNFFKELGPPVDGVKRRLEDSRRRSNANSVVVTVDDVAEMKRLRSNGLSLRRIAERLGFGATTVHEYLTGAKVPISVRGTIEDA